jgi:hypothetical protein
VNFIQLVQQEENESTSRGSWSIEFRGSVDVHLGHLRNFYLLLNFDGKFLGELKFFNKSNIFQNITLGVGKRLKESVLKLLQLDLETILLLDELFFLGSEIWSLHLEDKRQELILKTGFCDSEVNQSTLGLDFWWIMRVGELGMQEKVKVGVQGKFLVSHLDIFGFTLLNDCSAVNWLNYSVNRVLHVLNQDWLTIFYTQLNSFCHLWIRKSSNLEVSSFIGFSEPNDTLKLRIDNERVSF